MATRFDAYSQGLGQRRAEHVAGRIRAKVSGVTLRVTSEREGAASKVDGEYRHEDWRKVRVSVDRAPAGANWDV